MQTALHVTAFYSFTKMDAMRVSALREELFALGESHDLRGLVLLAEEGINGTVCGSADAIARWKQAIERTFGPMRWNDSECEAQAFPRWHVKIRKEIVALKRDGIEAGGDRNHLSPEEWHAMLGRDDVMVIDTRNDYETAIGTFEGAVDPKLKTFQEFVTYAASADLPKDKKILLYCTGGIRCEKAIVEMQRRGYENVYQLRGGILAYMKAFPQGKFTGECFVFDHRVAVDGSLRPSQRYGQCPHCGDPGDRKIACSACGKDTKICTPCAEREERRTCSKRCRAALVPAVR